MSIKSFALAAVAALCLSIVALTGAPVMAQTPAAAPVADPARVPVVEHIYDNLRIIEVMGSSVTLLIMTNDDYKDYTPAERAKLSQLFMDDLMAAKPALLHKLAVAHVGTYSMEQLTTLLNASKIKYVQQLLAKGADDSLPDPDPSTMTVSEKAIYDTLGSQQFTEDFLTDSADFSSIEDDVTNVAVSAFQKLADWSKTQPQGT